MSDAYGDIFGKDKAGTPEEKKRIVSGVEPWKDATTKPSILNQHGIDVNAEPPKSEKDAKKDLKEVKKSMKAMRQMLDEAKYVQSAEFTVDLCDDGTCRFMVSIFNQYEKPTPKTARTLFFGWTKEQLQGFIEQVEDLEAEVSKGKLDRGEI